jgi:hypothetical protein
MPTAILVPNATPSDPDANIASGLFTDIDEEVSNALGDLLLSVANEWTKVVNADGDIFFPLTNLPGSATSITSVLIRTRAAVTNFADDTATYVLDADTIMSGSTSYDETDSALVDRSQALTGSPTVAQINAMQIRARNTAFAKTKGNDNLTLNLDAIELEVVYEEAVVVNGIALARLALRSLSAADKTSTGIGQARLAQRGTTATSKIATGIARSSLALRSLLDGGLQVPFDAVVVARLALRGLLTAGKTSTGTASSRLAQRAQAEAAKTSTGIVLARLGLRGTTLASKVADYIARASIALRTLQEGGAGAPIINAAIRASLALRSTTAGGKVAAGIGRARLALRSVASTSSIKLAAVQARLALRTTDGTTTSRTGQILGRLAIRESNDGRKTVTGVAFNRMALRPTAALQAGDVGSTVRKVPLEGIFDFRVPIEGRGNPVP